MKTFSALSITLFTVFTFSFSTLADNLPQTCGLRGSVKRRIQDCEKTFEKKASYRVFHITREMAHDPLGGMDDDDLEIRWQLVSKDKTGAELWRNSKEKKLWTRIPLTFEEPIPQWVIDGFDLDCRNYARDTFKLKGVDFGIPANNEQLDLALEQGLGRALGESKSERIVYCVSNK